MHDSNIGYLNSIPSPLYYKPQKEKQKRCKKTQIVGFFFHICGKAKLPT
jgi:hypothetical protein